MRGRGKQTYENVAFELFITSFVMDFTFPKAIEKYVAETRIRKRQAYLESDSKYWVEWVACTDTQAEIFYSN